MFERFTKAARDVVVHAQTEARELHHPFIGTEHTLLALVDDPGGPVARALRERGLDAVTIRDEIIRRVGATHHDTDPLPDADAEDTAALKAIGIDLDQVRRAIEQNFGPDALRLPRAAAPKRRGLFRRRVFGEGGHIPFSKRNKKVLELALREAIRLGHNFIAPEHIMLGLLREGDGLAGRILADAGVETNQIRAELEKSLSTRAA
jgi:ATP-dependent Clp protease ATP-binding subunit ClpA